LTLGTEAAATDCAYLQKLCKRVSNGPCSTVLRIDLASRWWDLLEKPVGNLECLTTCICGTEQSWNLRDRLSLTPKLVIEPASFFLILQIATVNHLPLTDNHNNQNNERRDLHPRQHIALFSPGSKTQKCAPFNA